jgi:hypothetical protein
MSRPVCVQRTGRQHDKTPGLGDRVNAAVVQRLLMSVKLTEGATSIQRYWHLLEGIGSLFQDIPAFSLTGHQER